jgi:hypothetical protein
MRTPLTPRLDVSRVDIPTPQAQASKISSVPVYPGLPYPWGLGAPESVLFNGRVADSRRQLGLQNTVEAFALSSVWNR